MDINQEMMPADITNAELMDLAIVGDKEARLALAHRYENGIGTTISLPKAYAWAFVSEPYLDNPCMRRIRNKIHSAHDLNSARLFSIKLDSILN